LSLDVSNLNYLQIRCILIAVVFQFQHFGCFDCVVKHQKQITFDALLSSQTMTE